MNPERHALVAQDAFAHSIGVSAAINTLRLEASIGGLQADEFFFPHPRITR